MEFQYSKIQAWKSWKINFSHGKSWIIEILQYINKVFYLFRFTSHNNNMNCFYITDFCRSEVNFVLLLYLLSLKYYEFQKFQTSRSWILKNWLWEVMEKSWNFKWEKVYEPWGIQSRDFDIK
jgi:hypothetical protein